MTSQRVQCPRCGHRRVTRQNRKTDLCRGCVSEQGGTRSEHALPPGAWRLNPFTRRQEYVYDRPVAEPVPMKMTSGPITRTNETIDHGTDAGYKQHHRSKIPYCEPCRSAHAAGQAAEELRRYEMGDPRLTCECGSRKNEKSKRCTACARAARRGIPQPHNQLRKQAA